MSGRIDEKNRLRGCCGGLRRVESQIRVTRDKERIEIIYQEKVTSHMAKHRLETWVSPFPKSFWPFSGVYPLAAALLFLSPPNLLPKHPSPSAGA